MICAVIPVYNHGETAVPTVESLIDLGLRCIVVDDGSDATTQTALQALAHRYPELILCRHQQNQGKGGAVMTGLLQAQRQGFGHALQIDADGQHQIEDVPKLLALAQANPQALIVGQPVYDHSAPKGRVIARRFTHFWVGLEILSCSPPDTLCGFRVYPLNAVTDLMRRVRLGRKMDFDIEVMVRLIWDGVPIVPLSTQVIYPQNGLSHFHYWSDNMLISWMHTKLFLGMLWRMPRLLRRKLNRPQSDQAQNRDHGRHWSEVQEIGAIAGIRFLLLSYRLFGRGVFKFFLYPITLYFFIFKRSARQASLNYLQKVYQAGSEHDCMRSKPGLYRSYQHFIEFGCSAIDRVASWSGAISRHQIIFEQREQFLAMLNNGQGGVIIGAHLGNIELGRGQVSGGDDLHDRVGSKMNILMFTEHAEKFNSMMKKVNKNVAQQVISVNQVGPDTAIMLQDKIRQGEMIVILGDRTAVNSKHRVDFVDFFGEKAAFAQGPFILASLLQCPVYLLFCLKRGKQYHVFLESFAQRISLPRSSRQVDLPAYMQRYAERLEYYCKLEPLQWFNFYDYWAQQSAVTR